MREELMAEINRITALRDPEAQARAIGDLIRNLGDAHREAVRVRAELVRRLRAADYSHAEVAELLGVHRGTAQQIAEGRTTGRRPARGEPAAES